MMVEWLTERCTTTDAVEVRRQEMASLDPSEKRPRRDRDDERFREWLRSDWEPFIARMQPGDELWEFCSPMHFWANLAGSSGYAIVRDGAVVVSLVTARN